MIINNTYFTGRIYLPEANPSITSEVSDVQNEINDFILEYVPECLFRCLGPQLSKQFIDQLDSSQANGLIPGADSKWDSLLNGLEYTDPNGDSVVWRGIRFKVGGDIYNRSLLAYYVYYHFQESNAITTSGTGDVQNEPHNAVLVGNVKKMVGAYRQFLKMVQGSWNEEPYFIKEEGVFTGVGVDYYAQKMNTPIDLYTFINDQNELAEDTYPDFKPERFDPLTQLNF